MKSILAVFIFLSSMSAAWADASSSPIKPSHAVRKDIFYSIRCGADIPKALIGQKDSNEKVAALEGRHKDLGLQDLGASEVSDKLSEISWLICGSEFMLLEDDNLVVQDVLPFPPHSESAPEFVGSCKLNGQEIPETIVAILVRKDGADAFPATVAWRIDKTDKKFVKIFTEGLVCPSDGIITADGGL